MAVKNQPTQPSQVTPQPSQVSPQPPAELEHEFETGQLELPDHKLCLHTNQVIEVSKLLGCNISTPDDLIRQLRRISTVIVDGESITFEPGLMHRLKSRCPTNVTFADFLRLRIIEWAHAYVGW